MKLMDKQLGLLYNEYVKAVREAYETEGHFYANKPRTPELAEKVKLAYYRFNIYRSKYYKGEKREN